MENFTERKTPAGLYSPRFEHDNCGIGAVVDIKGRKSHKTIDDALQIVEHLEHRAGKDAEGKTGDGVGILTQISDKFFQKAAAEQGLTLGAEREYGIGMFFSRRMSSSATRPRSCLRSSAKGGSALLRLARGSHLPRGARPQGHCLHAQHLAGLCGQAAARRGRYCL